MRNSIYQPHPVSDRSSEHSFNHLSSRNGFKLKGTTSNFSTSGQFHGRHLQKNSQTYISNAPQKIRSKTLKKKSFGVFKPTEDGRSKEEEAVVDYLHSLLKEEKIICNTPAVLKNGQEIDIYIPAHKLAIEFNGLYFHSEKAGRGRSYHLKKQRICEQKGIRLIQIFSDEWEHKKAIVKSILKGALELNNHVLTEPYVITHNERTCRKFFQETCLSGWKKAEVTYYAYTDNIDKPIAAMSFNRINNSKREWKIERTSYDLDLYIPQVTQKLLDAFVQDYDPLSITAHSDRRWFSGKSFLRYGFAVKSATAPRCWFTKSFEYRDPFEKWINIYKGDFVQMIEDLKKRGYVKIWDCGDQVYYWNRGFNKPRS